jgi:DNA-3-methyladenine glycosylase
MGRIITTDEIATFNTVAGARWLLGKLLVRRSAADHVVARMITEVEAYDGERDLACHARVGKTSRTRPLYQPAGIWYVYLCYGIHDMLNLVMGPADWPAAVLIRGVTGTQGPGRVTKSLAIDRSLNGQTAEPSSGLWLEDREVRLPRGSIEASPRIGVDYAGEVWAKKPWRFVIAKNVRLPPQADDPAGLVPNRSRELSTPSAPAPAMAGPWAVRSSTALRRQRRT